MSEGKRCVSSLQGAPYENISAWKLGFDSHGRRFPPTNWRLAQDAGIFSLWVASGPGLDVHRCEARAPVEGSLRFVSGFSATLFGVTLKHLEASEPLLRREWSQEHVSRTIHLGSLSLSLCICIYIYSYLHIIWFGVLSIAL